MRTNKVVLTLTRHGTGIRLFECKEDGLTGKMLGALVDVVAISAGEFPVGTKVTIIVPASDDPEAESAYYDA